MTGYMLISMAISMLIYWRIDVHFNITEKISSLIPIKKEWKSFIFVVLMFALVFIIDLFPLSLKFHTLLLGIIIGISISIISNLDNLAKKLL